MIWFICIILIIIIGALLIDDFEGCLKVGCFYILVLLILSIIISIRSCCDEKTPTQKEVNTEWSDEMRDAYMETPAN